MKQLELKWYEIENQGISRQLALTGNSGPSGLQCVEEKRGVFWYIPTEKESITVRL